MRTLPLGRRAVPVPPKWTVLAARPATSPSGPVGPAAVAVGRAVHRGARGGVARVGLPGPTLRLSPPALRADVAPGTAPGRPPVPADGTTSDPARATPRPALDAVAVEARRVLPVRHGTILQPR